MRTEGDLCSRHATGLVLPRGWHLHDERTDVRDPIEAAIAPAIARRQARGNSSVRVRRRRVARTDEPLPGLHAVPAPRPRVVAIEPKVVEREPEPERPVAVVEPQVVEPQVVEPQVVEPQVVEPQVVEPQVVVDDLEAVPESEPAFEVELSAPAREQLADVLDAQTPLLRRAFQNVWPFSDDAQSS